jgi:hypothetical protein
MLVNGNVELEIVVFPTLSEQSFIALQVAATTKRGLAYSRLQATSLYWQVMKIDVSSKNVHQCRD